MDNLSLTKRTYLTIPNYEKPIEFGVIYSFDYPVEDTGSRRIQIRNMFINLIKKSFLQGKVITVSTTRPETMFGDAAVAVHPDDTK